ncbi:MAG: ornithine carbamoyltransferase [Opitutae bacterium]|nr:ornithine carbamoyltransferase [Opitutae bacterium]
MRHFLKETDFTRSEIAQIFGLAARLKRDRGSHEKPLAGQTWAMIFSKSSTRTRVSFEVGIHELGGNPLFLNRNDIQLGRGETVADTAKVLSRFVHGLVVRTFEQAEVEELATEGTIPVINALTDLLHPCQIFADLFTLSERWSKGGDPLEALRGRKIAFVGDRGCNVANSWIMGANLAGMKISLAGPAGFDAAPEFNRLLAREGFANGYEFTTDAYAAVKDADVVYTDVWVSMGKEEETAERIRVMTPFAVTRDLMAAAKPGALFMHCLPAHAGQEVTQEILDSSASVIFDQAENRLHMQKAIMATLAQTK